MIWSSGRAARAARDVDALMAAEWALEDLSAGGSPAGPAAGLDAPDAELLARLAEADRVAAEAEAAAELERQLAEARAQGYEEGRRAGEEAEGARLRTAVAVAEEALDAVREGEMRWTGAIEENICALAVAVARQVIGRELQESGEIVVELVRRALAEFPVDQPVRIRVNPQDVASLEAHGSGATPLLGGTRGQDSRWVADARIAPGGCVVEGRERIVDGRVDTALERIYRRLTYNHA
jgi:flagellar biosynthesis/type III secretory pathway protein FliH